MPAPLLMRLVYAANVAVAGTVGTVALFSPPTASAAVFGGAVPANESMRLVGCLWLAVAALSVAGERPLSTHCRHSDGLVTTSALPT